MLLGNIPIIGELFRSRAFKKSNTELIIIITPEIAQPVDAISEIMVPAETLEGSATQDRPASKVSDEIPERSEPKTEHAP